MSYVDEVAGPEPIRAVPTGVAGFVGQTERGPTTPRMVTGWPEYRRWFGGLVDTSRSYLPWAVRGFFDNGGQRAVVARITAAGSRPARVDLATGAGGQALRLEAVGGGDWGNNVFARVVLPWGTSRAERRFRLTLRYFAEAPAARVDPLDPSGRSGPDRREPDLLEEYDLPLGPSGSGDVLDVVNAASCLVRAGWTAAEEPPDPPDAVGFADARLQGGGNGPAAAGLADYRASSTSGLTALEAVDEIALLCVPDEVKPPLEPLREDLLAQCERLKDRFAVLQAKQGERSPDNLRIGRPSGYGAIYWPWLRVDDPRNQGTLLVPPGGHVLGVYADTDRRRGVQQAPVDVELRGVVTHHLPDGQGPLEVAATQEDQDLLSSRGVNVIADLRADGRGVRVLGARTIADDPRWKYVNVRRLFIYLEDSIDQGTRWVVFEPNDETTWARVRLSVSGFLADAWRSGALAGTTAQEAFFVRCDRTTMTRNDLEDGRLVCVVGAAVGRPAEFVVFRLSQPTMEATAAR